MATRADFYYMTPTKELILVGCTSNEYDGDFEKATNLKDYLKGVRELLAKNNSIEGKWYFDWKNSNITDEVFVFKQTPKLFNRNKGILLSKVYVKGCDDDHLYFAKFADRYNKDFNDEDGSYSAKFAEKILLPKYSLTKIP